VIQEKGDWPCCFEEQKSWMRFVLLASRLCACRGVWRVKAVAYVLPVTSRRARRLFTVTICFGALHIQFVSRQIDIQQKEEKIDMTLISFI
jgi:hypothetical protein